MIGVRVIGQAFRDVRHRLATSRLSFSSRARDRLHPSRPRQAGADFVPTEFCVRCDVHLRPSCHLPNFLSRLATREFFLWVEAHAPQQVGVARVAVERLEALVRSGSHQHATASLKILFEPDKSLIFISQTGVRGSYVLA